MKHMMCKDFLVVAFYGNIYYILVVVVVMYLEAGCLYYDAVLCYIRSAIIIVLEQN